MMKRCLLGLLIIGISASPTWAEKFTIKKDATSQTIYVSVWDSSSTTGGRLTGVAYNASGFTCYYTRVAGSATVISKATQTVTGAYSSGGWVEVDATNAPGRYRFDLPDAILTTGVDRATIDCKGAANMVPVSIDIELEAIDRQDSVRGGLTALPNAAAGGAGGVPTWGATLDAAEVDSCALGTAVTVADITPGADSAWKIEVAAASESVIIADGDYIGYLLTIGQESRKVIASDDATGNDILAVSRGFPFLVVPDNVTGCLVKP